MSNFSEFGNFGFSSTIDNTGAGNKSPSSRGTDVTTTGCMSLTCGFLTKAVESEFNDKIDVLAYGGLILKRATLCGIACDVKFDPENEKLDFRIQDGTGVFPVKYAYGILGHSQSTFGLRVIQDLQQALLKNTPIMIYGEVDMIGREYPIINAYRVIPKSANEMLIHLLHCVEDKEHCTAAAESIASEPLHNGRSSTEPVKVGGAMQQTTEFEFW